MEWHGLRRLRWHGLANANILWEPPPSAETKATLNRLGVKPIGPETGATVHWVWDGP